MLLSPILLTIGLVRQLRATPTLTFPVAAQIPPVARVSQPFVFQFAATTFSSPDPTALTYSLSNAPEWLELNGSTRTFSGTPDAEDVGATTFFLTAEDDTGAISSSVNLTVVSTPAPRLDVNLSQILTNSGHIATPTSLSISPGAPFSIVFPAGTFSGPTSLSYYATSANRSPLPSWIAFDSGSLTFSGTAPTLVLLPQTYGLTLIASDVEGFAGASLTFSIIVTNHQLYFESVEQDVDLADRSSVSFQTLKQELVLDGQAIADNDIAAASAKAPPWLHFNPASFAITGQVPPGTVDADVSVQVTDVFGDVAQAAIHFHSQSPFFKREIGTIKTLSGRKFYYSLREDLSTTSHLHVDVALGAANQWLEFDEDSLVIQGLVPTGIPTQDIPASVSVTDIESDETETQEFVIQIISPSSARRIGNRTPLVTHTVKLSPSTTSTDTDSASKDSKPNYTKLHEEIAIPVGVFVALLVLTILICCCWHRYGQKSKTTANTFAIRMPCLKRRQKSKGDIEQSITAYPEPVTKIPPAHQIDCDGGIIRLNPPPLPALRSTSSLQHHTPIDISIEETSPGGLDLFSYDTSAGSPEIQASPPRQHDHRQTTSIPDSLGDRRKKHRSSQLAKRRSSGLPVTRRRTGLGHGRLSSPSSLCDGGNPNQGFPHDCTSYITTGSSLISMRQRRESGGSFTHSPRRTSRRYSHIPITSGPTVRKVDDGGEHAASSPTRASLPTLNAQGSFERRRQSYINQRTSSARSGMGLNPLFGSSDSSRDSSYAWRIPRGDPSSANIAAPAARSNNGIVQRRLSRTRAAVLTRSKSSSLRALPVDCYPIREVTKSSLGAGSSGSTGWETASSSYGSGAGAAEQEELDELALEEEREVAEEGTSRNDARRRRQGGDAGEGSSRAGATEQHRLSIRPVRSGSLLSQTRPRLSAGAGDGFPVLGESPRRSRASAAPSSEYQDESPVFL